MRLSTELKHGRTQVTLTPSEKLCFSPHPVHDGGEYESLEDLLGRLVGEGYGGGIRLLKVRLPRHRCKACPVTSQVQSQRHICAGDVQALLRALRAAQRAVAAAQKVHAELRDHHTAAGRPVGQLCDSLRGSELLAGLLRRGRTVRAHRLPDTVVGAGSPGLHVTLVYFMPW